MADQLYLNLWFPTFHTAEMLPRILSVMKQFPFSAAKPGIVREAVYPFSFQEAPVLTQGFEFGTDPAQAVHLAAEFLHEDYCYQFDAYWDLWIPRQEGDLDETWILEPVEASFFANGPNFEDGIYKENGHVQVDFGLDTPFLHEEFDFTPAVEVRVKSNVQKLVNFTMAVEKNCGITGRVLWSESDENLAQKLISRLQKVQ